jgi:hypothetical protein
MVEDKEEQVANPTKYRTLKMPAEVDRPHVAPFQRPVYEF